MTASTRRERLVVAIACLTVFATVVVGAVATTGVTTAQTTDATGPDVEWAVASHGTVYVRFSAPLDPASVAESDFALASERTGSVTPTLTDDDGDSLIVLDAGEVVAPGYQPRVDVGEVAATGGATNVPGTGPVEPLGTAVAEGGPNDTTATAATVATGETLSIRSATPNASVRVVDLASGTTVGQADTGNSGVVTLASGRFSAGTTYRVDFVSAQSQSSQYFTVREPQLGTSVGSRAVEAPARLPYAAAVAPPNGLVRFEVVDDSGTLLRDVVRPVDGQGVASGSIGISRPGTYRVRVTDLRTGGEATSAPVTAVQGAVVTQGGQNDAQASAKPVYSGDALAVRTDGAGETVTLRPSTNDTVVATLDAGGDGVATFDTAGLPTGHTYEVSFGSATGTQYVELREFVVGVAVENRTHTAGEAVAFRAQASRGDGPVRVTLLDDAGNSVTSTVRNWGDGTVDGSLALSTPGTYRVQVTDVSTGVGATSDPVTVTGATLEPIEGTVPKDADGDGIHEDLNANGRVDSDDVVVYFEHYDEPVMRDHVSAYDVNGNQRLDADDVVQVFAQI